MHWHKGVGGLQDWKLNLGSIVRFAYSNAGVTSTIIAFWTNTAVALPSLGKPLLSLVWEGTIGMDLGPIYQGIDTLSLIQYCSVELRWPVTEISVEIWANHSHFQDLFKNSELFFSINTSTIFNSFENIVSARTNLTRLRSKIAGSSWDISGEASWKNTLNYKLDSAGTEFHW